MWAGCAHLGAASWATPAACPPLWAAVPTGEVMRPPGPSQACFSGSPPLLAISQRTYLGKVSAGLVWDYPLGEAVEERTAPRISGLEGPGQSRASANLH